MQVGIIGCGKMASALLGRWLAAGLVQPSTVRACTARAASAAAVRERWGIACGTDPCEAAAAADLVVLALKPQQLAELPALQLAPGTVVLSLLAGVPSARLEALLPTACVLRAMPNTPVRLGLGLTALVRGASADEAAVALVQPLLAATGQVVELAETQMDAFTAVAGCGPAYVFALLESLAEAARQQGFDAATARQMAQQVAAGALALADGGDPAQLRAEVTSKGGMTAAALAELAARGWSEALGAAVEAARARGEALGRGLA